MVDYKKYGFAEIGYWLSLIGGLICTFFGIILIRWLPLLLYLGLLIALAALLQRMTYKTLASSLTVLFSVIYLVFWLIISGWSMVYNIQIVGFVGSLFGTVGGTISVFFSVRAR